MSDKNIGLYTKYYVQRIVGNDLLEVEDPVFILNPRTDPIAIDALRVYAIGAKRRGYDSLAKDVFDWIDSLEDEG